MAKQTDFPGKMAPPVKLPASKEYLDRKAQHQLGPSESQVRTLQDEFLRTIAGMPTYKRLIMLEFINALHARIAAEQRELSMTSDILGRVMVQVEKIEAIMPRHIAAFTSLLNFISDDAPENIVKGAQELHAVLLDLTQC